MLVVMCHGFEGSAYDMVLVKRTLRTMLPDAYFLLSKSNENETRGSIREMG
jgi:hypothetical protein